MQIPAYTSYLPQTSPRAVRSDSAFAQALKATDGDTSVQRTSASPSIGSDAAANEKLDYSNMTPRQFADAGKQLYKAGKIDIDQLFQIQWATGDFNDTQNETLESTNPVNYIEHFQKKLLCSTEIYGNTHKKMISKILNVLVK